ncbi:iron-siderophore ABC transporter substrate-binding protein [Lysinibacter sp. HNR]|nr:iron-siderophore ABC transporter substrate-binding protein [Lysinibacter sp. HNR]WGD38585.1 iron-siderophore ABC transporter substrate-binding protein [Lysinibacter sp. HNR]
MLAGCSLSNAAEPSVGAFAMIDHVYGTTVISEKPERVATVAWANHEVPLALGIVPVGMAKMTYGDDDGDGLFPWVKEKLDELGADTPVLFDETDGIDFEAVADTQPDVILASYSGITEEDYTTLSKIAPVVAFPKIPYGTSVDEMIEMNATALGLKNEGDQLIRNLHERSRQALAANPALEGKRVLFALIDPSDLSTMPVYTLPDTRPGFLRDLGLPQPRIVEELSENNTSFFAEVSSEEAVRFDDVDIIVTYGNPDGGLLNQLQADPLLSKIPAIASGQIVILPDSTPIATVANPSPLSIMWGVDEYLSLIANVAGAR